MSKKKISIGVLFGGISLAVTGLSGLIIYPLLLKNCTKEVAGLWLFYTSFTVIIFLGQAGLAPIVMRRAAAAKVKGDNPTLAYFFALINKSFRIVAALVTIICVVIYFSYVHWVLKENPILFNDGLIAWGLFVAGNVINIYHSKNFYIINGFGEVGWDKMTQITISIFTILGYFIVLKFGGNLVGLSVVFFMASLIYAVSSVFLLKRFSPLELNHFQNIVLRSDIVDTFKEGGEILVLNIVGIIVMNKDVFLVERFMGLTVLPLFSALNRVQGIIISISLLIPQMIFPFISQNFAQGNYIKLYKLYLQGVIFAVTIAVFLSATVLISANTIIPLWLGPGNYLGNNILALLFLMGLISIHHNAHASAVISTGDKSFMGAAIINGFLSLPFSIIGIKYYGISGMIIGNIIATIFPSFYIVNYSVNYFRKLKYQ